MKSVTITLESNHGTEMETIAICSEDSTKANIQALEDNPTTTRQDHGSNRQNYDNTEVQNLPRQVVLKIEREGEPTKDWKWTQKGSHANLITQKCAYHLLETKT